MLANNRNRKKIALHVSIYSIDDIRELIRNATTEYSFLLIFSDKKQYEEVQKEKLPENITIYKQAKLMNMWKDLSEKGEFYEVIQKVLDNHQTIMFSDRTSYFRPYGLGVNNFVRHISKLVLSFLFFYREQNPDYVYFKSTPHTIESWVNAQVAKHLGITILMSDVSVIPWRVSPIKGLGRDTKICKPRKDLFQIDEQKESEYLQDYVQRVRSTYNEAIPEYERIPLEKNKGKLYNLKRDLIVWWKRPDQIYNKYRCFKTYKKLSIVPDFDKKHIIYLMHYQPERTTLPEAYGFAQQLIAIKTLRSAIPTEVQLLVKEHPAMFTRNCDPTQRHPSFYHDVNDLEGVCLIDMNVTSFDLIDNSIAAATITGSAGQETLLRDRPIIYLGKKKIGGVPGCYNYKDQRGLKEFIQVCLAGFKKNEISSSFEKHLKNYIPCSISVRTSLSDNNFELLTERAKLLSVKGLIEGKFDPENTFFIPD